MGSPRPLAPTSVMPGDAAQLSPHSPLESHNCQQCVRRKVKCDRLTPSCSNCARRQETCIYRVHRARRLRLTPLEEKVARYEQTLRDHGLLQVPESIESSPTLYNDTPASAGSFSGRSEGYDGDVRERSGETRRGKLLTDGGKSQYVEGGLWDNLADREMQTLLFKSGERDNEGDRSDVEAGSGPSDSNQSADPISLALLGTRQSLVSFHPDPDTALRAWRAYTQNVDPLCKILHVPTTKRMIETITQHPQTASRTEECLLFSIYYVAVHSSPEEDCRRLFGEQKSVLLRRYCFAARQALVNASWLRSPEITLLQAYTLFLIPSYSHMDPQTYWLLVGVANGIARRMGLHRNELGLVPFEMQMRSRLFWELLVLNGYASQESGTGIVLPPNSWDTHLPLNCNDADMWPGMTEKPKERPRASDMIFVLPKLELAHFLVRSGIRTQDAEAGIRLKNGVELDCLVDQLEARLETKYYRYCEITNPLHLLSLAISRSVINQARLRNQIQKLLSNKATEDERKETCAIALKILDTDSALYSNPSLAKFRWQFSSFRFVREALICILASLGNVNFFQDEQRDTMWDKLGEVYANRAEQLKTDGVAYAFVRRLTREVWDRNPPTTAVPELGFITDCFGTEVLRPNSSDIPDNLTTETPDTGIYPFTESTLSWGEGFNFDMGFSSATMDWGTMEY
ncbi:mitogen-activated protein kinase [Xylariaceae sp. FL1019]|nr:mitogen-activated protein kinase [Xylariaceae sp. FL1019]